MFGLLTRLAAMVLTIDLTDAVHEAVGSMRGAAEQFGSRLVVEAEPGLVVRPTQRLATTCVRNLVENAIKYGGQDGDVRVSARREQSAEGGAWAVLSVSDDGPGIARQHLPHIFERFYRVDSSRSRQLGGTGLGLAIVKHIATAYGGRAGVDSVEGAGSTFTVRLPLLSG